MHGLVFELAQVASAPERVQRQRAQVAIGDWERARETVGVEDEQLCATIRHGSLLMPVDCCTARRFRLFERVGGGHLRGMISSEILLRSDLNSAKKKRCQQVTVRDMLTLTQNAR